MPPMSEIPIPPPPPLQLVREAARSPDGTVPIRHPLDMGTTRLHVIDMSVMIQIRHVPDALHRKLKARAAEAGMTLSDYLKKELEMLVETPTWDEWFAEMKKLPPLVVDKDPVEILREMRGE